MRKKSTDFRFLLETKEEITHLISCKIKTSLIIGYNLYICPSDNYIRLTWQSKIHVERVL